MASLPHETIAPHSVLLAAEPSTVPDARRFVVRAVAALGYPGLTDDAALCVSELATNAALHSQGRMMQVALHALDRGVRISVEDAGSADATIAPHHDYDSDGPHGTDDPLTSGRGLAIVAYLASDWGIDPTPGGKRVWADLDATG